MATEKEFRAIVREEFRGELSAVKQKLKSEILAEMEAEQKEKPKPQLATQAQEQGEFKCGACGCIVTKGLETCPNCNEALEW
jgi:hypothetical protein